MFTAQSQQPPLAAMSVITEYVLRCGIDRVRRDEARAAVAGRDQRERAHGGVRQRAEVHPVRIVAVELDVAVAAEDVRRLDEDPLERLAGDRPALVDEDAVHVEVAARLEDDRAREHEVVGAAVHQPERSRRLHDHAAAAEGRLRRTGRPRRARRERVVVLRQRDAERPRDGIHTEPLPLILRLRNCGALPYALSDSATNAPLLGLELQAVRQVVVAVDRDCWRCRTWRARSRCP